MGSVDTPHHKGNPKVFGVDKANNGKKVIEFKPRDLNIIWGKDPRYWNLPAAENEDAKPVKLLQVCWLEVTGSAENINPKSDYEVKFKLSLTTDAFGWGNFPVYLMVKRGKKGKFTSRKLPLMTSVKEHIFEISIQSKKENQQSAKELYFGLYEVWSGKWKGGLKIHNAIVEEV